MFTLFANQGVTRSWKMTDAIVALTLHTTNTGKHTLWLDRFIQIVIRVHIMKVSGLSTFLIPPLGGSMMLSEPLKNQRLFCTDNSLYVWVIDFTSNLTEWFHLYILYFLLCYCAFIAFYLSFYPWLCISFLKPKYNLTKWTWKSIVAYNQVPAEARTLFDGIL